MPYLISLRTILIPASYRSSPNCDFKFDTFLTGEGGGTFEKVKLADRSRNKVFRQFTRTFLRSRTAPRTAIARGKVLSEKATETKCAVELDDKDEKLVTPSEEKRVAWVSLGYDVVSMHM